MWIDEWPASFQCCSMGWKVSWHARSWWRNWTTGWVGQGVGMAVLQSCKTDVLQCVQLNSSFFQPSSVTQHIFQTYLTSLDAYFTESLAKCAHQDKLPLLLGVLVFSSISPNDAWISFELPAEDMPGILSHWHPSYLQTIYIAIPCFALSWLIQLTPEIILLTLQLVPVSLFVKPQHARGLCAMRVSKYRSRYVVE